MRKLLLATSNVMNNGPSVIRRTGFTKSNTELTNSLRSNFQAAWSAVTSNTDGDLTVCGVSNTQDRPQSYKSWTKQEGDTVYIPATDFSNSGLSGERSQYDITVKLFFLPTTNEEYHEQYVRDAVAFVLKELRVSNIDLLIMSFPGVTFDADDDVEPDVEDTPEMRAQLESIAQTWKALESLHASGIVSQLGLAEFGSERLKRFLRMIELRPSLDQINVRDCCVVPKSLITYAKQEKIELMTHNDSTNILPKGTIRELLGDGPSGAGVLCTDPSGTLCGEVEPQWVVKYTAVVKDRGVISDKGYFAMANLLESERQPSSRAGFR